jgi:YD repeat-containing protein
MNKKNNIMKQIHLLLIISSLSISLSARVLEGNFLTNESNQKGINEFFAKHTELKNKTEAVKLEIELHDFLKKQQTNSVINLQCNTKSTPIKTQKLDSLIVEHRNDKTGITEPFQLERWTWDENGNSKTWELYDRDIHNGKRTPKDKEKYDWDKNGNKTTHIDFDPDPISGEWVEMSRCTMTYDEKGNYTTILYDTIDQTNGKYINNERTTCSYDYINMVGIEIVQYYNLDSGEWKNAERIEFDFDTEGHTSYDNIVFEKWSNTSHEWEVESMTKSIYDKNDNLIYTEFRFPENKYFSKTEYTYDINGNKKEILYSEWDTISKQYIDYMKYNYVSDEEKIIESVYLWDKETNNWIATSTHNDTYNSTKHLIYSENLK